MAVKKKNPELERYQRYVNRKLSGLMPVFAKVSIGDFNVRVPIPKGEDEFTEIAVGVGVMLDVIREKLRDSASRSHQLAQKVEELERIRDELAGEYAQASAILASVGEALVVTDPLGRIVEANRQCVAISGWRRRDLLGKRVDDVLPLLNASGDQVPFSGRPIQAALAGRRFQTPPNLERNLKRKDGKTLPVVITVAPVRHKGAIVGAVSVYRDVTDERAIDQAKTEFVSLASHQLRTPLTIVKWSTERLMEGGEGPLPPRVADYLAKIHHANRRMIELVEAFLNVSRIELGTFAIKPELTDLVSVAKSVGNELEEFAVRRGVKLSIVVERDIPKIHIDPKLMRIVVHNLVSNAIKYTLRGRWVRVTLRELPDTVRIEVRDSGAGIPASDQPKIFTKLFRADNARRLDPDGTGLGLYIAKAIVEKFGGSIEFHSVLDRGTTFTVTMPRWKVPKTKEGSKGLTPT